MVDTFSGESKAELTGAQLRHLVVELGRTSDLSVIK